MLATDSRVMEDTRRIGAFTALGMTASIVYPLAANLVAAASGARQ